MKKTLYILPKVLMLMSIIGWLCGCKPSRPIKVLVVHQYDAEMVTYDDFDNAIVEEFRNQGYEPTVVNCYMNLEDQAQMDSHQVLAEMRDSLQKKAWTPDLILAEGDRTLFQWNKPANESLLSWCKDVPIVYGGVRFYNLPSFTKRKNTYVIFEQMNMRRNLDIITRLTQNKIVAVELDDYHEDSLVYALMNHQLGKTPYSVKKDSTGYVQGRLNPVIHCNDTVSIYFYSAEWEDGGTYTVVTDDSHTDSLITPTSMNRQELLDNMYQNAWRYPVLVPKKDVWCEAIASKTYRPQFTTCHELFKDGRGSYLAGYFAGYASMAREMVKLAVGVHEGKEMPQKSQHAQNAYMDWVAMDKLGMKYSDYKDDFIIDNAPMKVTNPLLYSLVTVGNFLWIALLVLAITLIWLKNRKNSIRNLSATLDEEKEMNQLAMDASGNFYISTLKGIERVLDSMGPDQDKCKEDIKQSLTEMGTHTHSYRIRAAMDEEKNMAWWNLRYQINYNTMIGFNIEGYLLNVNDDVNYANEMKQIQKIADETKRTEGFLWTMAHEIRTPLNSIVGFCDVIKMMGNDMNEEERAQIVQGIESNNELLEKIVYDMDGYSRAVANEIVYEKEQIDIAALMEEVYAENSPRFKKQNLKFLFVEGRRDVQVQADRSRLKEALTQLVDNALKFTKKGSVAMGWEYSLEYGNVELFVEDSGVGINEEDLPLIYDMFWKKDTFIPGVGIGLALAKAYVEAMGGKLKVVSEQGIGSRFIIILKVKESA